MCDFQQEKQDYGIRFKNNTVSQSLHEIAISRSH